MCSYLAADCILEQTHAVYNAAWVVSDSYIASYLFPYFLCQSLLLFLTLVARRCATWTKFSYPKISKFLSNTSEGVCDFCKCQPP